MGLNLVSKRSVDNLVDLLKNTALNREIRIELPEMNLNVCTDTVSETLESEYHNDMEMVYFTMKENYDVLQVNSKFYELFFNLGDWGTTERRYSNSHLVLGTNPVKFGSTYFSQIELSQAFEDGDYIYIVKNMTKLAGEGAIARLNKGLGSDRLQKIERRETLLNKYPSEVIVHEGNQWLCICKIDKSALNNDGNKEDIFFNFMNRYLEYAFIVESIVARK